MQLGVGQTSVVETHPKIGDAAAICGLRLHHRLHVRLDRRNHLLNFTPVTGYVLCCLVQLAPQRTKVRLSCAALQAFHHNGANGLQILDGRLASERGVELLAQ